MKDLVFIASGGRTGTTFFGDKLDSIIDDCWSEHTPDMWSGFSKRTLDRIARFGLWNIVIGRALGRTGLRALGQRRLTGKLTDAQCIEELHKLRNSYHASIDESLIIESYSRWWMLADLIPAVWPHAKLIGVIRDPRDWIISWQRHQPRRHTKSFIWWFPLGALTPKSINDETWANRWDELGQFGRLAWDWHLLYSCIDKAASENALAKVFRFEDIFSNENSNVRDLVDFAAQHGERRYPVQSLDGFIDDVRNSSKGQKRHWRSWSSEEARLLDSLCGPLMQKYGYGTEPEWLELIG